MSTTITTTTKVTTTTVADETLVVDLTGTNAAELFTELEAARAVSRASAKREAELKAALEALTGTDVAKTVFVVDGVEVFKKAVTKTTSIDRDTLRKAFSEAFKATYSERPIYSFKAV